ncbi:MAG TPA: hypothetical protein VMJ10_22060 [Kofleriaceae bacterium]|nr:hypothetical protein [Kofleriaceae bacterium]
MRTTFIFFFMLAGCVVGDLEDGSPVDIGDDSVHARVTAIATISYAPNSFVIGNAYPGWTDIIQGDPQRSAGPGNEGGADYRWGYLYGEDFDRCAWIDNTVVDPTTSHHGTNDCGTPKQIDTPYFLATFTDGIHNQLAGDGSVTHMQYDGSGCTDTNGYGNVEPWRVPATPNNALGQIPNGKELRWRYVTRDGKWVLVRDPEPEAGEPNWYFVHRGCVSVANVD